MDIQENPVKLGNITMKEKLQEKYLGDILSSHGLSDSVKETIKKRDGKIRGAVTSPYRGLPNASFGRLPVCPRHVRVLPHPLPPDQRHDLGGDSRRRPSTCLTEFKTLTDEFSWPFLSLLKEPAFGQRWAC